MKNLEILKKWIDTLIKVGPYIIVFEVIIGAIMAVASSQVENVSSLWSGILVFSILLFIAINIFKYYNEKNFPKLIIQNIENEINKDSLSRSFARKSLINEAIATSLVGLNEQTCELSSRSGQYRIEEEDITERMCEKDIEDGIMNLLQPLINNMHLILESFNSKFTVGAFLETIVTENPEQNGTEYQRGIYTIKDDLNLVNFLDRDLLDNQTLRDEKLEIQNILVSSRNNNRFEQKNININNDIFTIISSPIPLVCNDNYPDGLFIIIGQNIDNLPNDTGEIFKIFNRILANWISKYNECVHSRVLYKNENK